MRRECRERLSRHRLQRKPSVNDSGVHHETCVKHVPWGTSASLTRGGGENDPGFPGASATRNFTYLAIGPLHWMRTKTNLTLTSQRTSVKLIRSVRLIMNTFGLGYGLVPSGNRPLPWPMLTNSYRPRWFEKQNKKNSTCPYLFIWIMK